MSIPESQLDTWSHQGSITQSSSTYGTIKRALEGTGVPYAGKDYEVFLQGSYGNDTNIYAESDVDVVIKFNDCFQHDLTSLSEPEKQSFHQAFSSASYTHVDFKRDVLSVLTSAFGRGAKAGGKAIKIPETDSRRSADVIAAIQFRRYHKFNGVYDQSFDEGICFYDGSGQRIANYPKQHSENMTAKHQSTNQWLKPMVRILKNMRSKMVGARLIHDGCAPSYYIEGLLYNVPKENFAGSYGDALVSAIRWIQQTDQKKLLCANEQYYLLWENTPTSWDPNDFSTFLQALVKFWNEWT